MGRVARALTRRPPAAAAVVSPRPTRTVSAAARGWATALAALCGAGLVAGIPSRLVPDGIEPAVGVGLLTLAARAAFHARRRGARP